MIFRKHIGTTGDLLQSPPDRRDLLASNFMPPIVRYPEVFPRMFDLDILNQHQEPSCVGFTAAVIKQFNELKEKEYVKFDGNWIYQECKKIDGMPNVRGTFFRTGLTVLKNIGAMPLGGGDASKYRIAAYAQVDNITFEELKKYIALYGMVFAGYRGTNEGWRQETIRAPRAGETIWGHAVALTNYDKNYLIGQNSWGTSAHNQGLFRTKADYLPFEAWIVLLDKINEPRTDIETGYVAQVFLDFQGKTTVNLNVREEPTTSSRIIKTLPRGSQTQHAGTANYFANGYWWREIILPK